MKTTKRFNCLRTYAKTYGDTGLVAGTISRICNGKINKPKKYIFKFKEEC